VRDCLGHDYMCVAIHPKRNLLFNELLFRDIGVLKSYPCANYAPALGKYLDVHCVAEEFSKPGKEAMYDIFVRHTTDLGLFSGKFKLSIEDLRYFFVEKNDIFKFTPPSLREFVQSCYPESEFIALDTP
jgi:hypothetical protein